MKLRPASVIHADDILRILDPFIISGVVLPRNKTEIIKGINSFFVAELNSKIIGCVAIKDYSEGLFEIRSLAVEKEFNNQGIGKKLISMAVENIIARKSPKQIFALTLRPEVFLKAGFKMASKKQFPKKIWDDCSKCSKFDTCDELALAIDICR
ncbi:MAG TPA: GNAT family N-acetyltransferase [Lentisphaeria bacterium]|nr:MAG: hypothetical protein A2X47_06925 [Lentisphaerae bacterium GWF2_38_69]HBM15791.1 GNAT family N-acetyltransferase [Lentisphaeria bacterium]